MRGYTGAQSRRRVRGSAAMLTGLALAAAPLLAGCGSPPSSAGVSAGSCAAGRPAAYLQRAHLVFIGTMLPGPAVSFGGGSVLVSPAHVKVVQYLKGTGPADVWVQTGVNQAGAVNEDGIQPGAGQTWTIYTTSRDMPYQTSICNGASPMPAASGN